MKRILVVAAHPDDEVLGCGGSIAAHIRRGDTVHVAILAQGLTSRAAASDADLKALQVAAREANSRLGVSEVSFGAFPDNSMDAVPRLTVIKYIEELMAKLRPQVIYTHHFADLNVDHRRVCEAVATACRPQPDQSVETILFFEVPSSTEWQIGGAQRRFEPNWFCDITHTLDAKLSALEAYKDEMREWPHARSIEAVLNLARWRGASNGLRAAEAFVLGRRIERPQ